MLDFLDEMSEDWRPQEREALRRQCAAPGEAADGEASSSGRARQEKYRLKARVCEEIRHGPRLTPGPHA